MQVTRSLENDALLIAEERRMNRWNLWIQIGLGVVAAICLTIAIIFAIQNADARSCPLTYDKNGVIKESHLQRWAEYASWTITTPKWDNAKRACVCDADPDPSTSSNTKKTPVWIAPIDLYNLYPLATFPSDFPNTAQEPEDHIKVCLERTKLDDLWNGRNATGYASGSIHCHNLEPYFEIYTGWDGDLYCRKPKKTQLSNQLISEAVAGWLDTTKRTITEKKYGHINDWDTSQVTSMTLLFSGLTSFNEDISNWDTSQVTDMSHMFSGATSFDKDINTRKTSFKRQKHWDTSNVKDMTAMFQEASSFNQDISKWNMGAVTKTNAMFSGATLFNKDISEWKMGAVTTMGTMFLKATSFNKDISKWDTSQVTNLDGMFSSATSFNQDISKWVTSKVTNMNGMFASATDFSYKNSIRATWRLYPPPPTSLGMWDNCCKK